jgi:hypothetical protein
LGREAECQLMKETRSLLGGDPGNHLPRLDGNISQAELLVRQLLHGCTSATLHLIRRALQFVHACFARALRRPLVSAVCRSAAREVMSEQLFAQLYYDD